MLTKFKRLFGLLWSKNPRDKIYLDQRLSREPSISWFYCPAKQWWAWLTQRESGGYLRMQKRSYDLFASADKVVSGEIDGDYVVGSWREHDQWPDYEDYLMQFVPPDKSWVALEYGCGPGRNIRRWGHLFKRIDGVDISEVNLANARRFTSGIFDRENEPQLYLTEGNNCGSAPRAAYDFAFSTICLQHICVHAVRFSIFQSLFECLKPGGRLSAQMGFGVPSPHTVGYYENHYQAVSTNRQCDVAVESPDQIAGDLKKIGFIEFQSWIRPVGPGDVHPNWIFFTARKPEKPRP